MGKTVYKVQFFDEKREPMTIYAQNVSPSEMLGFIEASEILFLGGSELIVTPEDEKVRKQFSRVERSHIPINSIIRIDEVRPERETPIIRLLPGSDAE